MSDVADKVRKAADHIEKYGLHKGHMYADATYRAEDELDQVARFGVPCCTAGALHAFGVNTNAVRKVVCEAAGIDHSYDDGAGDEIPNWNDSPERTAVEVVVALRKAADRLEEQA